MKNKITVLIISILSCVNAFAEKEFQYFVVPIGGITGISEAISASKDAPKVKYGGMIDAKYADTFFDVDNRKKVERLFISSVVKSFPNSAVGPNQIAQSGSLNTAHAYEAPEVAQCSPKFKVDYKDAFVISIGVSRLSVYFNDYTSNIGKVTQVIVPVTYTVRFLKLDGAQTIFSKSETITSLLPDMRSSDLYEPGSGDKDIRKDYLQKLKDAVINDAGTIINRLVDYSVKNFDPKQNEVTVIYKDNEFIAFNKGSEAGFSSGEAAYASGATVMEFTPRYVTEGLSVLQATGGEDSVKNINKLREGEKLSFSFSKQGVDDSKPTVLAIQYEPATEDGELSKSQIIANSLQSILADNLGFKVPFNLLKVDPDFNRLKTQIRSGINCDTQIWIAMHGFADVSTVKRTNPDLFLKLDFQHSPDFTTVAENGVTKTNRFQSSVVLSLIDQSNVVRQNFSNSSLYENQRTDGKGLSDEQAREVNLKNTTLMAGKAMVDGFKLPQKILKISTYANGKVSLSEPVPGAAFEQLSLVRPVTVGKKTVMVPIPLDDAALEDPKQDGNSFKVGSVFGDKSIKLKASDLVLVKGDISSARKVKLCDLNRKRIFLPEGLKDGSGNELAFAQMVALASGKYKFVQTSEAFTKSMDSALARGVFESSKTKFNTDNAICVLPFEYVKPSKIDCPNNICDVVTDISLGFRQYDGDKKINEAVETRNLAFKDMSKSELSKFIGFKIFELQSPLIKDLAPKF